MAQGVRPGPLGDIGGLGRLDDDAVTPCCRPTFHSNKSRSCDSMALRYRPPLPRSTLSSMRSLPERLIKLSRKPPLLHREDIV